MSMPSMLLLYMLYNNFYAFLPLLAIETTPTAPSPSPASSCASLLDHSCDSSKALWIRSCVITVLFVRSSPPVVKVELLPACVEITD